MQITSLDNIPLSELRPYDVYQLQLEFHCYSPREAYEELCRRSECHSSKAVAALLPSTVGAWDKVQRIDLSRTYVGPKGIIPVIELCKRLPSLCSLNVSGNYLQNDSVWFLAQLAAYHPCLSELDVSNNEFISWSGAMCLAAAVVQNVRLTFVNLLKTAVEPVTAEAVFFHTRRNAVAMAIARGRTAPNPTRHPSAIHLRAMHRFFDHMKDPLTGCVPRDVLVQGYGECLHTLGREAELEARKPSFFEALRARAPGDKVTWEMFLVLVLLDAVEYVDDLVRALRRVFIEFNLNANVGQGDFRSSSSQALVDHTSADDTVFTAGFVEAEAFSAIHQRLYSESLRQKDLDTLRSSMGLESDSSTVNWDEFLYIWYNKGPAKGVSFTGANLTQLPRRIRPVLQ